MQALDVPTETTVGQKQLLYTPPFGIEAFLPTIHFEPKLVEIHRQPGKTIAWHALNECVQNYSDTHLKQVLEEKVSKNQSGKISQIVLTELAQQAATNNADTVITRLHIGAGPDEPAQTTLAVWDNGHPYETHTELSDAFLEDGSRDLRDGVRRRKNLGRVNFSRFPTLAVLYTAIEFGGQLTVASQDVALDITASNEPQSDKEVTITPRVIEPIEGVLAVARFPHLQEKQR